MNVRKALLAMVLVSVLALPPASTALGQASGRSADKSATAPATGPATTQTSQPSTKPVVPPPPARVKPLATEPAGKTLDQCRAQFMRGQYAAAASGYKNLLSRDTMKVAAATGAAQALSMEGKYTDALDVLAKVSEAAAKDVRWHLTYANVLTTVGQYDKALEHAKAAHALNPASAQAILAHGQLLEVFGKKDQAREVYKSMDKVLEKDDYKKDPEALVALGHMLDRDCVLNGKKASEQAANILNNYFQEAYLAADKTYWPANVAAGLFGLAKHRPDIMEQEFRAATALNGRIPEVSIGRGYALLEQWQFEQCLSYAAAALAINPNHPDALLLKAVCLMQWRKFDDVPPVLDALLKVNPNHPEGLSVYAANLLRTHQAAKAQPYIDRVHKVNPTYHKLPDIIGQWLAAGRQFDEAQPYFLQAIKLAPEAADPLTNLGLAYMQMGEEDKAWDVLTKANKIDDYRADVVNYINLLRRLRDEFVVKETEHFIVKVHKELDGVLLEEVADYCETMYAEITSDFDYHPKVKSIVEFFPTHQQFSVRITGRGWIGTVGASTGRVIAMVAPSPDVERTQFGTYNWATVLRHEYTHTVTLAKTENRIPHWFTEACAVWEQPDRRNYQATQLLVTAVKLSVAAQSRKTATTRPGSGQRPLYPVKDLDWGFIRGIGADRSLAYAQSEWIMEYIIETHKYPTIIKMLEAFRDKKTQAAIFKDLLQTTEADFDKAFLEWAKKEVQAWGFDPQPAPDVATAQSDVKKNEKDPAAQARLAVAIYYSGNVRGAEAPARKALELDANNRDALAIVAHVALLNKKWDEALAKAQKLSAIDRTSKIAPRVMADVHMEKRQWAMAIGALELLKQRAPLDPYSYEQLANCYQKLGQPEKAVPNLIELHTHTMSSPVYARQIAELYRALEKYDEALKYYGEVIKINPYEASAHQSKASIYYTQRNWGEAIQSARNVTLVQGDQASSWVLLAKLEYYGGRQAKSVRMLRDARRDAEHALSLDAEDEDAKELLVQIDEQIAELPPEPQSQPASQPASGPGN